LPHKVHEIIKGIFIHSNLSVKKIQRQYLRCDITSFLSFIA